MENYRSYSLYFLFLLISFFACKEPDIEPSTPNPLSPIKQTLTSKTWKYSFIYIEDSANSYFQATSEMEPICGPVESFRNLINKRGIIYSTDGTYQLVWEPRGEYNLGTEGDPNWQPRFGSYELDEEAGLLIHNKGLPNETIYEISIRDNEFIRTSIRYMSADIEDNLDRCFGSSPRIDAGDSKIYIEKFRPDDAGVTDFGISFRSSSINNAYWLMRNLGNQNWQIDNIPMDNGAIFKIADAVIGQGCEWGLECQGLEESGTLDKRCTSNINGRFIGKSGTYNISFNEGSGQIDFELTEELDPPLWIRGSFNSWGTPFRDPDLGRFEYLGNNQWSIDNLFLDQGDEFKLFNSPSFGACEWGIAYNGSSNEVGLTGELFEVCGIQCNADGRPFGSRNAKFTGPSGFYILTFNNTTNEFEFIPQ